MISHLGRYEIISEIGQGAMGVVYKATDPLIDRVVAIKTINLGMAQEEKEEYEGRFYQEAKAAGRLSHPNIVTIYDVGKSGEVAYIAMEFLQGRELRDVLNEAQLLPVRDVLDIVSQVASGLAYAHENGIVHRDVKPSNIMVIRDDHVKITDFGIARMESASVRTQTGMVLGSPKYMSPEQVMGHTIDQRSDIFSLGVMLYEMLTGKAPFTGENINAIMYQTMNVIPAPPKSLNPAVPEMLNYIVAKALAKDLDARYQNARELANDLRACRESLPQSTSALPEKTQLESGVPYGGVLATSMGESAEDSKSAAVFGLSPSFDSAEATMILAALTASHEDVEEISRTLQMARPSINEINRFASGLHAREGVTRTANQNSPSSNIGGYLLLAIIALVVIGLLSSILF